VMVPLADEATVVKLLENFGFNPTKDTHGVYSIEMPGRPISLYFKAAHQYLYFTAIDKGYLDDARLIAPEKITSTDPRQLFGATLRIEQIPDQLKQIALGQIDLRLAELKDRKPDGETPDQRRQRRQGLEVLNYVAKTILSEGKTLQVQIGVDRARDDLSAILALDGKPGTTMAQGIALLGAGKTRLAAPQDAAFHFGLNLTIPEMFRPLVDMAVKDGVERQADPGKKDVAKKLYSSVAATLKRGELDAHLSACTNGDGGPFSVLAGISVEKGDLIEGAVRELVAKVPEAQRSQITLDAETVGATHLHKVSLNEYALDENARQIFGSNACLWSGFSPSAVLLGLGARGPDTLRNLTSLSEPKSTPAVLVEASVAKLAPLDRNSTGSVKLAKEVFGPAGSGGDTVRLTLDGGKNLKLSATFKGLVLKFFRLLEERRRDL